MVVGFGGISVGQCGELKAQSVAAGRKTQVGGSGNRGTPKYNLRAGVDLTDHRGEWLGCGGICARTEAEKFLARDQHIAVRL